MTVQTANPLQAFQWSPQPQAQDLAFTLVSEFLSLCSPAAHLAERLRDETGTRFGDWIDYLAWPALPDLAAHLEAAGFKRGDFPGAEVCCVHRA